MSQQLQYIVLSLSGDSLLHCAQWLQCLCIDPQFESTWVVWTTALNCNKKKVVFKIFLGILSSNLWCTHQKSDLVWIYLCIQGENNFVLHHHTSKRSRPFPICWLLENIPSEPEGDNTKQVKRGSHASKCIHTLKNVCLSASFSLPPYVQLTHTHTSHCSHSKYCVVRSHCCVSRSLWAC